MNTQINTLLPKDCILIIIKFVRGDTHLPDFISLFRLSLSCKRFSNLLSKLINMVKVDFRKNMSIISNSDKEVHLLLRVFKRENQIRRNMDNFCFISSTILNDRNGYVYLILAKDNTDRDPTYGYKKI